MNKTEKHEKTEKPEQNGTLTKRCVYKQKLVFSEKITIKNNKYTTTKHRKYNDFSGFWAHFGRAKVIQNDDFFET